MTRIALFSSTLWRGAVQRMFLNLADGLRAAGHEVDVVTCHVDGDGPPVAAAPIVLDAGWTRRRWMRRHKRRFVPASTPRLATYLRERRPQALLAGGMYANLAAVWAGAWAGGGTRVVLSEHTHLSSSLFHPARGAKPVFRLAAPASYRRAQAVVGVSAGVSCDLVSLLGLSPERVFTLPNPVVTGELEKQLHAPLDHAWFAPGAPPVVLAVSALRVQKDLPTLLRAFALLRRRRRARLLVLGEGNQRTKLERLARQLGLDGDVSLAGHVKAPLAYMQRAGVLALSSVYEGLPTVLIEGLLAGCPIVSTDCPAGPSEILDRGRFGTLVPVGRHRQLAAALEHALAAPHDPEPGRRRARFFSASRSVAGYEQLLVGRHSHDDAGSVAR